MTYANLNLIHLPSRLVINFTLLQMVCDPVYISLVASIAIHKGVSSKVVRYLTRTQMTTPAVISSDAKASRLSP